MYAELETKRILLDIFKEKQQKSAEAGSIPSFYKKVGIDRLIGYSSLKDYIVRLLSMESLLILQPSLNGEWVVVLKSNLFIPFWCREGI